MNEFLSDPAIVGEFVAESREHLESVEPKILQLEKNPTDLELLNDIFRSFHTIKGSSSFLGLTQLTELSHKLENVLDKLRKKMLKVTPEIIDLIFKGIDILKLLIEDVASGQEKRIEKVTDKSLKEVDEFIEEINQFIKESEDTKIKEDSGDYQAKKIKVDEDEKQIFIIAASQHLSTIRDSLEGLKKDPSSFDLVNAIFRAIHSLKSSSDYMGFSEIKELTQHQEEILRKIREEKIPLTLDILSLFEEGYQYLVNLVEGIKKRKKSHPDIQKFLGRIKSILKERKKTQILQDSSFKQDKEYLRKKEVVEKTIRVPEAKLDLLMNLVSELVINRSAFFSISQRLDTGYDISQLAKEMKEATQTMRRITGELQATVTDLHMLPIKTLFDRFPRLVRDISRKKGKQINLEIKGEETQLDKMMIEKMNDPLIHLVRNAIDHGIEPPQERETKGKPARGTIKLSASQEGESVIIQIEDDGRGMDPDLIRQIAVKKGIIDEEKAKILDRRQCLELIFLPGFSTATKVTDISGRGVGMDVVKDTVKKLKGEVEIYTELNQGTRFVIKLPLTMAIVNVLLIEVADQLFALPLSSIKETLRISMNEINKIIKKEITLLRGDVLGIANLADLLGLPTQRKVNGHLPVVVIQAGGENLGLVVNNLYRQEEIVIKPLEGVIANTPAFAGAAILGDGKIIPVLDPQQLIYMAEN